jgi:hypothetical protein
MLYWIGDGPLAQLEQRTRIAWSSLLHNQSLVFVELLREIREADVDSIDPEPATQHPFFQRMPGQPDTRLKILQIPIVQSIGWMNNGPHLPRQRVHRGRTEIADQAVRRVIGTLGGPSQSEIERQVARKFPVVLEIQAIDRVARQPRRCISGEVRLAYRSQKESGEGVASSRYGVPGRLQACGHVVELEDSAGLAQLPIVVLEMQDFIAHLEGVRAHDLAEVVAERNGLPDVSVRAARAQSVHLRITRGSSIRAAAQAAGRERGHQSWADVWNAQSCAPVLIERSDEHVIARSQETDPRLVERGWPEQIRRPRRSVLRRIGRQVPRGRVESLHLNIRGTLQPVLMIVGVAPVDLEVLVELMIHAPGVVS